MKYFSIIVAIALLLCVLSGCTCQHEWLEATCTAPKTCAICNQTEGECMNHVWANATCETPKSCTVCNTTEGEAAGHTYGLPYPLSRTQCYVCKVCKHRETAPLSVEGYTAEVKNTLAGEWEFNDFAEDFPFSARTLDGFTIAFSDTECTFLFDGNPLCSFPWTIENYQGWTSRSSEESLEGVSVNLCVPHTGNTLVLDNKSLSIERISLTEEITTPSSIPLLVVQMAIDGHPADMMFIKDHRAVLPDEFTVFMEDILEGNWYSIYDEDVVSPFDKNTLEGLSLCFSNHEGTLYHNSLPIYSFPWEIDNVIPWSADSYTAGNTVLLSLPFMQEPLMLGEIQFFIESIELDIDDSSESTNCFGLRICVSIEDKMTCLNFVCD